MENKENSTVGEGENPTTELKGTNVNRKPGHSQFLIGNACILLATIFWGINIPVVKALAPEWMSTDAITFIRIIGACVLFWLSAIFIKQQKISKHDMVRLAIGGAVGLFGFIYLLNLSLKYANPIDVSIIMTLPPVFVILINVLFRHNRPSLLEYIGIFVGLAGAVIVILGNGKGHSGQSNLIGDLIALASTLCYSAYLVITEGPSHTYRPVSMLKWVFLFAAIPSLILIHSMHDMPLLHSTATAPWLEAIFVLLCPSFIAYFLLSPALKKIGSELVSLYQYLLPVVSAIASVLMGVGKLHWLQVIAMAIIIAGMVCTNLGKKRRIAKTSK